PGLEIILADDCDAVLKALRETPAGHRRAMGEAGRKRIVSEHTAAHRAAELERYLSEVAQAPLRVSA
ncbi:MAG TPA: glycosyltransferase, partial [Caulobacteraceae bacterium]|nr:glycosyltransferase [Caulobacteraceae bacterium]